MPSRVPPRGPGPWRQLVAALAPPVDRSAILDDLAEEYGQRLVPDRRAARRWYRQQVLRSAPWLIGRRLRVWLRANSLSRRSPESHVYTLAQDLKNGFRTLARAPLLSGLVVAILALGIGVNTALFSLINPVLLRSLPYDQPERLVQVFETDASVGSFGWNMLRQSLPTYETLRDASSFEDAAAYMYRLTALRAGDGDARGVTTGFVTANTFELLGVEPAMGRNFTPEEDVPGNNVVVLLADSVWRTQFGADPDIVGRRVFVDGEPNVVVGVMSPGFNFPYGEVRMWKPAAFDAARFGPDQHALLTVARLREGVSHEAASAELRSTYQELTRSYPEAMEGRGVRLVELRRALVFFFDELRVMMLALLTASGLVLLIVCANVANLMLSWSARRQRDLAVRASLGAGRGRLVRQLLTENSLLAMLAGVLGIALARAGIGAVSPVVPAALYRVGEIEIDAAAVAFTIVASAITALAFGLAPAVRASRVSVTETLKEGRPGAAGPRARRFTRMLVLAQVTVATFLCGSAMLSVGVVRGVSGAELGFDPDGVVSIALGLPASDYPSAETVRAFHDQVRTDLGALPGVQAVGWIDALPLDFATTMAPYRLPETPPDGSSPSLAEVSVVSPGYFETMQIPVVRGRGFEASDSADGAPVVVINELLSEALWPQGSAVGENLIVALGGTDREATVVGVVRPTLGGIAVNGMQRQVFVPHAQNVRRGGQLLIRSQRPRAETIGGARAALARLDPNLPVDDVRSIQTVVDQAHQPVVTVRNLLSGFGIFALVLAGLGVYGVAAYAVAERTHEIGVRMAVGATRGNILKTVMSTAVGIVAVGAVFGIAAIVGLQVLMSSALEADLVSPVTPILVGVLLTTVAAFASWLPARRASQVDPVLALRG